MVRQAIVTVEPIDGGGEARGQGVLVAGRLVLTAAHCVVVESVVGAALGDYVMVWVTTQAGERFRMSVYAFDPFADIAVLGPPDNQEVPEDADAFERFADATEPLRLHRDGLSDGQEIAAVVYAHTGESIPAWARQMNASDRSLFIKTERLIRGGTSGGPITTTDGVLLAVVSQSGHVEDDDQPYGIRSSGVHPYPARALPVWAVEEILLGQVGIK